MRVSSRTRHRVARRLTRAARSTPPNPPQMASKDGSTFFFTSESVNEGHPDKLADQVRDRATCRFGRSLATRTVAFSPDGIAKNEPRRPRSVASPASLATRLERSADEPSSTRVPTDLRRCPRCLPRPGPRLQGASPAAKTISRRVGENNATRFRNVFRDARGPRGNARRGAVATASPPREEAAASAAESALRRHPSRAARSARSARSNARPRRASAAGGGHVGRAPDDAKDDRDGLD